MHKVAILTYDHAALFELGCAVELFALPRPEFEEWYDCDVVSFTDGPLSVTGGISISAKKIEDLSPYSTLIIPSWPTNITALSGLLADEVKRFHQQGKRILSFCSGAFLPATLGFLDGRKATTHWRYANKFKVRFPKVGYIDDVLYVYESNIGCSAGSASAIDLSLEVIRNDYGYEAANKVARRLVMSAHRNGGQSQFVETPIQPKPNQLSETLDWALLNLDKAIKVQDLATRANMSRRTFDRKFRQTLNISPKEWLITQQLNLARELLERSEQSIEHVAEHSGFDNATTLRHHFRKNLSVSPRQYRNQFAAKRHEFHSPHI